ncbi:hypothetical protein HAX54_001833 [Datura stramonium]|uniref:Uncharacterized protein n=1 Tax=Datura stramonium TaxID=4076 RepID=A0ABS8T428_DATST|nr:hypothetical protein [Datura stramonium]
MKENQERDQIMVAMANNIALLRPSLRSKRCMLLMRPLPLFNMSMDAPLLHTSISHYKSYLLCKLKTPTMLANPVATDRNISKAIPLHHIKGNEYLNLKVYKGVIMASWNENKFGDCNPYLDDTCHILKDPIFGKIMNMPQS